MKSNEREQTEDKTGQRHIPQKDLTTKRSTKDNLWVLYIETYTLFLLGQLLGTFLVVISGKILSLFIPKIAKSDAWTTCTLYMIFIGIWILMLLYISRNKERCPVLKIFWTKPAGNNGKKLLLGFLIGFGLNGLCILIAWLCQDIVIYYDAFHPISFIIIFAMVFIQSSAEEAICRGYLFQKLLKIYGKPVIAIVGNSMFFAILHLGNEGVTLLSVINIFLVGIFMSFIVYYMDSLWCTFAVHTAWNFTQNIIFGLPNSGIVVPYSVFKLEAGTAVNSLAYNVGFGIEGTLIADIVMLLACGILFLWGRKYGKKPTDIWAE